VGVNGRNKKTAPNLKDSLVFWKERWKGNSEDSGDSFKDRKRNMRGNGGAVNNLTSTKDQAKGEPRKVFLSFKQGQLQRKEGSERKKRSSSKKMSAEKRD